VVDGQVEDDQLLSWVERVANFWAEEYGLPLITGRVLGCLMICQPAEQSATEIADAIGASRASLTTNMQLLVIGGLVHRRTRPGKRTTYYSVNEDTWRRAVERKLASLADFRDIAADGLDLVGVDSERAGRIRAAHGTFDWLGKLFAAGGSARGLPETGRPREPERPLRRGGPRGHTAPPAS
jgi:DNA-binding MarR family transcriptional regulator